MPFTLQPGLGSARLGSARLGLGACRFVYIFYLDQTWIRSFTSMSLQNASSVCWTFWLKLCVPDNRWRRWCWARAESSATHCRQGTATCQRTVPRSGQAQRANACKCNVYCSGWMPLIWMHAWQWCARRSINQSINQPINQSINQSTNQPINQSINQTINQSINFENVFYRWWWYCCMTQRLESSFAYQGQLYVGQNWGHVSIDLTFFSACKTEMDRLNLTYFLQSLSL